MAPSAFITAFRRGDGRDRLHDRPIPDARDPGHRCDAMALVPGRRDVHGVGEQRAGVGHRPLGGDSWFDGRVGAVARGRVGHGGDGRGVWGRRSPGRVHAIPPGRLRRRGRGRHRSDRVDSSGAPASQADWLPSVHWPAFAATAASAGFGAALGHVIRLPGGLILGPMVVGAVLRATGVADSSSRRACWWRASRSSAGGSVWSSPGPS